MTSFVWSSVASFGNPAGDAVLKGFGDFSGDGKTDLLLFDTFSKLVGYWQTNGAQEPVPVSLAQVAGGWVPVGAENLAGAGNAQIIWRQTSTGALGAWRVNGSSWSVLIGSIFFPSAQHGNYSHEDSLPENTTLIRHKFRVITSGHEQQTRHGHRLIDRIEEQKPAEPDKGLRNNPIDWL